MNNRREGVEKAAIDRVVRTACVGVSVCAWCVCSGMKSQGPGFRLQTSGLRLDWNK